jgi:hypothetical protein
MKINHLALNKSIMVGKIMENMIPINHDKLYGERALLKDDQPNMSMIEKGSAEDLNYQHCGEF